MKRMYKIYTAAAILTISATFASCELDNYDSPDASIYGEVKDIETGERIQQDVNEGSTIIYEEFGFENPDKQTMIFKVNGEYRNNLLFSGKYDIYFEQSNFVIPERMEEYKINPGENRLDFVVQPYIRISDVTISRSGEKIVARFTVTPSVDNKVSKVGLFGHIDYIVGDRYAQERAEQNVNEAFKDQPRVYTLELDASRFKAGQKYFFRVGARIDVPNAKYNYAPSRRLTI